MTLIVVVIAGIGSLLMVSAIENSKLQDTFLSILNGQGIPQSVIPPAIGNSGGSGSGGSGGSTSGKGDFHWLSFAETQQYGQSLTGVTNTGIDLATPFHTPLTSITSGTVVSTTFSPQIGGQILVAFQYAGHTMYAAYVHLDTIAVQVGQQVGIGDVLGLSGGQLSGGTHNAQYPYSTGPHTLFGIFRAPSASFQNSIDPKAFFENIKRTLLGYGGQK